MRNSVYSNTVKVELLDSIMNPSFKSLSYILVVLVKIWEIWESAVLDFIGIIPIVNLAFHMIMVGIVKRCYFLVILIYVSNMIGNYIKHDPDIFRMGSSN